MDIHQKLNGTETVNVQLHGYRFHPASAAADEAKIDGGKVGERSQQADGEGKSSRKAAPDAKTSRHTLA